MRIAVDALSVTNLSGRRVLLGHLGHIAQVHRDRHQFIVLIHRGNRDLITDLGANVRWVLCPRISQHWTERALWQLFCLEALLDRHQVNLVLTPTGALSPGTRRQQIVLAQNPWCFVPAFHTNPALKIKAALQRRAYRSAQNRALVLFCNSNYLSSLYARHSGRRRPESILPNGIDEALFAAAEDLPRDHPRPLEVLTVSVMTPHKSIEGIIDALVLLRDQHGVQPILRLVGPWADTAYRRRIEQRIAAAGLTDQVVIHGHVSDAELHQLYGQARVFCLLSRCESFGLPAVEAQVFGTPSVVADAAAAPEIAGPGGVVVPPDDPEATASALATLLLDPVAWQRASQAAFANAKRFRWSRSSGPLIEWLSSLD